MPPDYDGHRANWMGACQNALVVFDEIPSRRESSALSLAGYTFFFAVIFGSLAVASAIMWFRFSGHPPSVWRKLALADYAVSSLTSGVFLLTARSATPRGNHKRLFGLLAAMTLVQLILDVLR